MIRQTAFLLDCLVTGMARVQCMTHSDKNKNIAEQVIYLGPMKETVEICSVNAEPQDETIN